MTNFSNVDYNYKFKVYIGRNVSLVKVENVGIYYFSYNISYKLYIESNSSRHII